MSRFLFLFLTVAIASGLTRAAEPFPNVIVILTDDQGYGDLACHGNPHLKTPHLDRLHSRSVRFTDFHVSPTCAPTRSALLTGRHEFYNGVTHTILERERLSLKAVTLTQELKRAGYRTGIFGKWHLGDENAYQPGKRGFDEVFIHGAGGIGQTYPGSCGDAPGNNYVNPVIRHNGVFEATQGYCTDVFFRQAISWMSETKASAPFFAWIAPNAPHAPLIPPPGYVAPGNPAIPADVAKFYAMIENIDENVGRLMKFLAERGLEKDTLVIFMTDNGSAHGAKLFAARMRGAKGTPYEGGTRVPCFWSLPGRLPSGRDCTGLTISRTLTPTLLGSSGCSGKRWPTTRSSRSKRAKPRPRRRVLPTKKCSNESPTSHSGRSSVTTTFMALGPTAKSTSFTRTAP